MESRILLWIHHFANPTLDSAFRVSHHMGTVQFCAALVVVGMLWQLRRRRPDAALLLLVLGLSTFLLQHGLKLMVDRPRPELWPRLLPASAAAFPSGHALAAATFYPALAWLFSAGHPRRRRVLLAVAVLISFYVGVGRLYLGVHWPTDVFGGWLLGVIQTALGLWWLEQRERPEPGQ